MNTMQQCISATQPYSGVPGIVMPASGRTATGARSLGHTGAFVGVIDARKRFAAVATTTPGTPVWSPPT